LARLIVKREEAFVLLKSISIQHITQPTEDTAFFPSAGSAIGDDSAGESGNG
jgi:hypothetical protein